MVQALPQKSFESSQHFKNWLAVVAKNRCISLLRKKKIEKEAIIHLQSLENSKKEVEFTDSKRNNSITPEELKQALNSLTKAQKRCFELLYFKGYKITEQTLFKLNSEGLPPNILNRLETIRDQEIRGEGFFHDLLKSILNGKIESNHLSLITKYAFFSDRKSYKEIGEITGYSFKEIKSHIQTGKKKLKKRLKKVIDQKENTDE